MTRNNLQSIIVDFEPISRRIFLYPKKSLYETLVESGIRIRALCGGSGKCGKCKILIQKGIDALTIPNKIERELLEKNEIEKNWRLACQTYLNEHKISELKKSDPPHVRIFLPDDLLIEDFKILTEGIQSKIDIKPTIIKLHCVVDKPTLNSPIADFERMLNRIESEHGIHVENGISIEYDVLKKLPFLLWNSYDKINDGSITLTQWNERSIIDLEQGNQSENNFGIAIDIGTTTVVGYLINLNNGKTYAVSSKLNPQTAYGEDVVTRITFVKENEDGLDKLHASIIEAVNDIISKTCKNAKVNPSQIYEASIVGNSVMHHLFLGIDPIHIGLSPYVPVIQKNIDIKAKDINLKINSNGNVHLLPLIAGYVGADTMGVILASNIHKEDEITLAIDIGTNGEIVIGNKDILATGSCAAGSALEGAHIRDGMRAASGSIDTVKIDPGTLEVNYTTIKNRPPIGICGSGLIDLIAEMLKSKIITRSGSFNKEFIGHERILKQDKDTRFVVVNKENTALNRDITLSQSDIRQIQMAKSAFYSGMRIMLEEMRELKPDHEFNINQIFLAGAFGNYIDKENAKFIGMIPDIPSKKIFQVGNAAGSGAKLCLLNKDLRIKARQLLNKISYIEIAIKKKFQREFAEAMYFPHMNLDYFPNLKEYLKIPKR